MVVTGVLQARGSYRAEPWNAPTFASREDAPRPPLPRAARTGRGRRGRSGSRRTTAPGHRNLRLVQVRACHDDDDPGEIAEGWFSIDGKVLTVTDANGRHVGSRAMLEGEDARVVAKQLLRGKKAPEEESFNRPLSYPNAGLA